MLLVLDVGNTNTVLGVFAKAKGDGGGESQHHELLVANWRVATIATQTVDEYGVLFRNLFAMDKIEVKGVHGIIISSVVPPVDSTLRQVCERYFNTKPLFIEPGVKTGMPVLYDNPAEVGADRIVNGVAAFEKYGGPCVVVDFGTATGAAINAIVSGADLRVVLSMSDKPTFDVISHPSIASLAQLRGKNSASAVSAVFRKRSCGRFWRSIKSPWIRSSLSTSVKIV